MVCLYFFSIFLYPLFCEGSCLGIYIVRSSVCMEKDEDGLLVTCLRWVYKWSSGGTV